MIDSRFSSGAPTVLDNFKRRLFWIVARTCFAAYRALPLFGPLRASVGVIARQGKFLVILRNDGRGFSLPGGISSWREAKEDTLRREVMQETGLTVTGMELKLTYKSNSDLPCTISIFEVQVSGEVTSSWEGSAQWLTLDEFEPRLVQSQRPALDIFRGTSANEQQPDPHRT